MESRSYNGGVSGKLRELWVRVSLASARTGKFHYPQNQLSLRRDSLVTTRIFLSVVGAKALSYDNSNALQPVAYGTHVILFACRIVKQ